MYELRSLTKRYGDGPTAVDALREVTLDLRTGEFVAIVGPSGSGKSTMLQLLGALDRPTDGSISFDGRNLEELSDRELTDLRRDRFGFVFQQFNLLPTLGARDNVEVALVGTGLDADERRGRAAAALNRVGLAPRADHLPSQLSGGEQQRVAIARALVGEPDVVLADEPTGNLDRATGAEVMQLLREINGDGERTVILVTHDGGIAADMNRVVEMSDGRVVESH